MRKITTILLVGIMIVGLWCIPVFAQDNELEEIMGLEVKVWYEHSGWGGLRCEGILLLRKGNWLIVKESNGTYTWCYIPTIRGIEIITKNYEPRMGLGG